MMHMPGIGNLTCGQNRHKDRDTLIEQSLYGKVYKILFDCGFKSNLMHIFKDYGQPIYILTEDSYYRHFKKYFN